MKRIGFILTLFSMVLSKNVLATNHDCEQCRDNVGPSVHGSTGKWADENVPHRNWVCNEIEDLNQATQECEMCEKEIIRYVHRMTHANYGTLNVGCICAGHMEGDIEAAESRDKQLKSRVQRRNKWLQNNWKISRKGNPYLKTRPNSFDQDTHLVTITRQGTNFSSSIDGHFLNKSQVTEDLAKLAAFDYIWPSRIRIAQ